MDLSTINPLPWLNLPFCERLCKSAQTRKEQLVLFSFCQIHWVGALKICKRNFYEFHKLSGAPLFIVKLKKSTECFIIIRNLPRVRFWESGARSWAQNEARKYKFANCDCDALLRSRNCIGLVLHKKWEATIHFLVNFYLNLAVLVLYIHS